MVENDLDLLHLRTGNFVLQTLTEWHETMVVKRTTINGRDEFLLIHTPSEDILIFFPVEVFELIKAHLIQNALGHTKSYAGIVGYELV